MKNNQIDDYTKIFKALSNPIRLKILMHIAKCRNSCHKHNISELSEDCNVDFSVVSRHLKTLKDLDILISKKVKNDVLFEVNKKVLKEKLSYFIERI